MALRKMLPGLIIVLVVLLGYSLLAADISAAYRQGPDNDGDIDNLDFKQFSKSYDDSDLKFFAGNWGAKILQLFSTVPGDVDLGISPDEQQGGGGLVGETVRIINGNSFVSRADVFFASAHTLGLGFSAFYNSQSLFAQSLGVGWSHTYSVLLNPFYKIGRKTYIRIVDATGRGRYFRKQTHGVFAGAFQERSHVAAQTDGFIWHRLNGSRYGFSDTGRLSWIDDEKDNRLQLGYDGQDRLDTVTDLASGRTLTFNYNENDLIESIAGPVTAAVADGIRAGFGYDTNLNLASVIYADGSGFDYTYADGQDVHNLTAIHNRAGHLINTWSYDAQDRCIENLSPNGRGLTVNYVSNRRVKVTDAYGIERTYVLRIIKGHKRLSATQGPASPPYTDTLVRKWRYDNKLRLVRVEHTNGTIHKYRNYDKRGNPRRIILAAGTEKKRKIYLTYHPRMNALLSRTEASVLGAGSKVTIFDYDDDGNDTPNENPTGLISRIIEQGFTHNQDGDVTAYEYVTRFAYNERGQVLSVDGPLPGDEDTTEFSYDPTTGDLDTVIRPLIGATFFLEYDAAGQPGKFIDVNGQSTRLSYDGRGRVTATFHDTDQSSSNISYNIQAFSDL
jgi:YD repeat-containing protein